MALSGPTFILVSRPRPLAWADRNGLAGRRIEPGTTLCRNCWRKVARLQRAEHVGYFVHNFVCNQATRFARLPRRQFGRSWTQRVPIMRRHRKLGIERSHATFGIWSWGCAGSCQLVRAAAKPTRCYPAGLRGRGRPCRRTEGYSPAELTAPLKSSETPRARFQARGSFPRQPLSSIPRRAWPVRPANIGSAWNPVSPFRSKGS